MSMKGSAPIANMPACRDGLEQSRGLRLATKAATQQLQGRTFYVNVIVSGYVTFYQINKFFLN